MNVRATSATIDRVITGETGAGKSIIINAVELLLGGKTENAMVRAGAEKATVDTFHHRKDAWARMQARAMQTDLSWARSAADYGKLYEAIKARHS